MIWHIHWNIRKQVLLPWPCIAVFTSIWILCGIGAIFWRNWPARSYSSFGHTDLCIGQYNLCNYTMEWDHPKRSDQIKIANLAQWQWCNGDGANATKRNWKRKTLFKTVILCCERRISAVCMKHTSWELIKCRSHNLPFNEKRAYNPCCISHHQSGTLCVCFCLLADGIRHRTLATQWIDGGCYGISASSASYFYRGSEKRVLSENKYLPENWEKAFVSFFVSFLLISHSSHFLFLYVDRYGFPFDLATFKYKSIIILVGKELLTLIHFPSFLLFQFYYYYSCLTHKPWLSIVWNFPVSRIRLGFPDHLSFSKCEQWRNETTRIYRNKHSIEREMRWAPTTNAFVRTRNEGRRRRHRCFRVKTRILNRNARFFFCPSKNQVISFLLFHIRSSPVLRLTILNSDKRIKSGTSEQQLPIEFFCPYTWMNVEPIIF